MLESVLPSTRYAIVSTPVEIQDALIAQLALLGEHQAFGLDQAEGAFVAGTNAIESIPAHLPVVLIEPAQTSAATSIDERVVARCPWPMTLSQLESALAALYRASAEDSEPTLSAMTEIVGDSQAMRNLKADCGKVAQGQTNVLLTGPSGTGKSHIAQAIHAHSPRGQGPFVPVNCGAIPAELVESELFGHEKGAFTGAFETRTGRFERATGGTLFLDEVGDLPYTMQVKLLRAIQERTFERVGSAESLRADVRIIAATNADLEAAVAAGTFREDLFYRLNVFPIAVPSLAERMEDLALLIDHFSTELERGYGHATRLTAAARDQLSTCAFPGNLRELRNLLERLTVQFGDRVIDSVDLPKRYRQPSDRFESLPLSALSLSPAEELVGVDPGLLPVNGIDLKAYLADLEQSLIEQALKDTDSVVARAADRLHIRRTTLVEKMRKYGIERQVSQQ